MWFAREALVSAGTQPVLSGLVALVVGLSVLASLVTSGQTDALERSVLTAVQSLTTRTITVTGEGEAELPVSALHNIEALSTVDLVYGLGPASDYYNRVFGTEGTPFPVYTLFGEPSRLVSLTAGRMPTAGETIIPESQLAAVGMSRPAGGLVAHSILLRVRDDPLGDTAVVGAYEPLRGAGFTPDGGLRLATERDQIVRRIVVVVGEFDKIPVVRAQLPGLTGLELGDVLVSSSLEFEQVLDALRGRVGTFSRSMTLVALAIGSFLTATVVFAAVQTRRRDFGRRRALGAGRGHLVGLVVAETLLAAVVGVAAGTVIGWVAIRSSTGIRISFSFVGSLAVLATAASGFAATAPAVIAASRDPVRALRVP